MPSLPWILALTLTFLHCLSASPTKNPKKIIQRSEETLTQIATLNNISCLTANSTFYITSDVQDDHIEHMLNCAASELKVVREECFEDVDGPEDYFVVCSRTIDTIKDILKNTHVDTQNKPADFHCEGSHKPYKEFLNDLRTLIQKLNNKLKIST